MPMDKVNCGLRGPCMGPGVPFAPFQFGELFMYMCRVPNKDVEKKEGMNEKKSIIDKRVIP